MGEGLTVITQMRNVILNFPKLDRVSTLAHFHKFTVNIMKLLVEN